MIYTIEYSGKWLSLNEVYNSNRYVAAATKREWKAKFRKMFTDANITPFTTFKLLLVYNSRFDCENTVAGLKIAVDILRELGLVENDDKRYYKGVAIEYDNTLTHNIYIIKLMTDIDCK